MKFKSEKDSKDKISISDSLEEVSKDYSSVDKEDDSDSESLDSKLENKVLKENDSGEKELEGISSVMEDEENPVNQLENIEVEESEEVNHFLELDDKKSDMFGGLEENEYNEALSGSKEILDDFDYEKKSFLDENEIYPAQGDGPPVSSSGQDVFTRTSLLNFYDRVANGDDVQVGSFDSPGRLLEEFEESHGEELSQDVSEVLDSWVNWPTNESAAPLWHIFAEANENFNVPDKIQDEGIDAAAYGEALHSFSEFTQEELEDRLGDSVVLYRSIDKAGFDQMADEETETGSYVLDHRPVESWTIDPEFAEHWDGQVILRKEVDVEDVLACQVTHPSFIGMEKEFLVESEGREKYSEDEILMPGEFDVEENAEWALSQLGGREADVDTVYGPEWMERDNAVGSTGLAEYGAITASKSSEFMHVAEYEDGREAFVTELSPTEFPDSSGADPVEAERAIAGEQFFENIGLEKYIPEHFVDLDEGYMAVEAVDGYEIDKAPEEVRDQVDAEEYLQFAAATVLSGNSDMDGRNTMIDEEGNIYGIDIDHSGGDFTEGGKHYRRGMRDLKQNADKLGLDISYSDIKDATQVMADEIDSMEATEGIRSSQLTNKDKGTFRQNVMNNITSFASGDFPGEYSMIDSTTDSYGAEQAVRV